MLYTDSIEKFRVLGHRNQRISNYGTTSSNCQEKLNPLSKRDVGLELDVREKWFYQLLQLDRKFLCSFEETSDVLMEFQPSRPHTSLDQNRNQVHVPQLSTLPGPLTTKIIYSENQRYDEDLQLSFDAYLLQAIVRLKIENSDSRSRRKKEFTVIMQE